MRPAVMLTKFSKSLFVFFALSFLTPLRAHANNVLDAPMWDVVGINSSQMLPSPAAMADPIQVEPGTLPVRWPNNGSLVKAYNKKGLPRRQQEQNNVQMMTPMAAPPAGI